MKTVYTCTKCEFTFERAGEIDTCPDCGHMGIRLSTAEEVQEYQRNREEFADDK